MTFRETVFTNINGEIPYIQVEEMKNMDYAR